VFSMGSGELAIVMLAMLPGLLMFAIGVWLVVTVLAQGRRIDHLEHRLREMERRGHA
jgi:hypothetical protein